MMHRWVKSVRARQASRLAGDDTGATIVEFGFVAPILITLIMGIFDVAHTQYTAAIVNGAMQKAGRDLTLESAGSQQGSIDAAVVDAVAAVAPKNATVTLEKLSHFDFSDIGEPEDFVDNNSNGVCDNNELFEDDNGNGQWDADKGQSGIGGARDAVLYTATVTYPRLFPMAGLVGMSDTVSVQTATVLRNQPFDEQDRNVASGNCT